MNTKQDDAIFRAQQIVKPDWAFGQL